MWTLIKLPVPNFSLEAVGFGGSEVKVGFRNIQTNKQTNKHPVFYMYLITITFLRFDELQLIWL